MISSHTSGDESEKVCLHEHMNNRLRDLHDKVHSFIGQDSNVQVGMLNIVDEGEIEDDIIGKYGATNIDNKGRQLLDFFKSK